MATTSSFFRAPTRVQLREWLDGYMFALPFIIGFLVFFLFPMGYSAWLAAQKWDLIGEPVFVGFANIQKALTDELAQLADRNERVAALRAVLVRFDEVLADHQRNVAAVRDGSTILSIRWARSELADLLTASKTLAGPVTVGTGATGSAPIDGEISAFSVTGLALFT